MRYDSLRGKFLVIDGPDGAGKSTQTKLLGDFIKLQGVEVTLCRDPGGTRIGEKIRDILLDREHDEMSVRCEAMLYMASRSQLYAEQIAPALRRGQCVLSDRWVSSTYAYQAVAGKLGPDAVIKIAEAALERTWPDLTIILDVPADKGLGRLARSFDRMEQKGSAFHQQVRQAFLELAQDRKGFVIVDAAGDVADVQQRLVRVINDYVDS